MRHDPILRADRAEEQAAADALRAAKSQAELIDVWWKQCEGFSGTAWDRLSGIFRDKLRSFGVLQP